MNRMFAQILGPLLTAGTLCAQTAVGESTRDRLREAAEAILAPLFVDDEDFALRIRGYATKVIDLTAARVEGVVRRDAEVELEFQRTGTSSFALVARTPWADVDLRRTAEETVLYLPKSRVVFRSKGSLGTDTLEASGFTKRLLGKQLSALGVGRLVVLNKANTMVEDPQRAGVFRIDGDTTVRRGPDALPTLVVESKDEIIEGLRSLSVRVDKAPAPRSALETGDAQVVQVPRAEMERMVFRALRRLLETYVSGLGPRTKRKPKKVEHGELRIVEGQRLALLHGTPQQIGRAHGELLGDLVRKTVDSSLYLVGLVETVREGKWFPHVLDGALAKLARHIPDRHKAELDAVADAVPGLTRRELRLANVFPEYFHCSGFAVFGSATRDGKLYHGRVLDYMTMIGLQHAAVTFVVKPAQGYGFLNVGYAGFIGSVTGMNERQISLGEMGGRGRLQWDGVPMATLMRRALEECSTLAQVKDLWRTSPRTCEYFYVFADGKPTSDRPAKERAVGVAATPRSIEFLEPGKSHPRLGEGIADTVLLSAGSRLKLLRQRVQEQHGKIDAAAAIRLMDRPVAMHSNLHNALMVPEDGVAWVAHATQEKPAAETGYVQYALRPLLAELPGSRRVQVRDTIRDLRDESPDASALLRQLDYPRSAFDVDVRPRREGESGAWHALVEFASPKPAADEPKDRVVLEWYRAHPKRAQAKKTSGSAPAVLVLHILDGRMRVARGVARVLANNGCHAFVMHMAGYGRRGNRPDAKTFFSRAQQSVSDARRARDAIAALPGVAPDHISVQGTSLGGFVAALAGSLDGCFDKTFLVLAGGELRSMFENGQKDTRKIRRSLEVAGVSSTEMNRMLDGMDPLRLAHRLPAARTWLYSAKGDLVVPAANASALGRAARLDGAHHLWFDGNHYTVAIHLSEIMRHMVERL